MTIRGVVYLHSAPPALCRHVEWAIASVLGGRISLAPQPDVARHGPAPGRALQRLLRTRTSRPMRIG